MLGLPVYTFSSLVTNYSTAFTRRIIPVSYKEDLSSGARLRAIKYLGEINNNTGSVEMILSRSPEGQDQIDSVFTLKFTTSNRPFLSGSFTLTKEAIIEADTVTSNSKVTGEDNKRTFIANILNNDGEIDVQCYFDVTSKDDLSVDIQLRITFLNLGNLNDTRPQNSLLAKVLDCPSILIKPSMDVYEGNSLSQVIVNKKSFYLSRIEGYVIGTACSLTGKILEISNITKESPSILLEEVVNYGILRYYLWFKITGQSSYEILRQRYDSIFFEVLARSDYSCYISVFESIPYQNASKWYIK